MYTINREFLIKALPAGATTTIAFQPKARTGGLLNLFTIEENSEAVAVETAETTPAHFAALPTDKLRAALAQQTGDLITLYAHGNRLSLHKPADSPAPASTPSTTPDGAALSAARPAAAAPARVPSGGYLDPIQRLIDRSIGIAREFRDVWILAFPGYAVGIGLKIKTINGISENWMIVNHGIKQGDQWYVLRRERFTDLRFDTYKEIERRLNAAHKQKRLPDGFK